MDNSFIKSTVVLSFSGLILRIIGLWYRIFLSRIIGAQGMGLLGLLMPVYSLILLTLTSGITVTVSKIVAAESVSGSFVNVRRITKQALGVAIVASVFVSLVMLFGTDFIIDTLLNDKRIKLSFLVMIPFISIITLSSVFRGYFIGVKRVMPVAISQIIEQIVKIMFVYFLIDNCIGSGLSYTCGLATLAMVIGETANFIYIFISYLYYEYWKKKIKFNDMEKSDSFMLQILRESVPISGNRFVISVLSAIESLLIPGSLVLYGLSNDEGLSEYGKLTGMAMPLIFMPTIITGSIASNLVPALSEASSQGDKSILNFRISKSISVTIAVGFFMMVVFGSYSNIICDMIYPGEMVGGVLKSLSFSCVLIYLQQVLLGILNGLGRQIETLIISSVGYIIRIAAVALLIPMLGINGYIWGLNISGTIVCVVYIMVISKNTGMCFSMNNFIIKPLLTSVITAIIGSFIIKVITGYILDKRLESIISLAVLFCVFMVWVEIFKIFNIKDMILGARK
jgi:stage V sporulation protein B